LKDSRDLKVFENLKRIYKDSKDLKIRKIGGFKKSKNKKGESLFAFPFLLDHNF